MTDPDPLLVERPADNIIILRLNRPAVRNALNLPVRMRLSEEITHGAFLEKRKPVYEGK